MTYTHPSPVKYWIGDWLMGVAVLHAVFAVVAFGEVLMPVSGFWLAFPPAIALLRRAKLGLTHLPNPEHRAS
jgi:hypothetical protein